MALKTKKKKKQSKKSGTSKIKTDRSILEEIIRVDHAGEYGATRIYDGQFLFLAKILKLEKLFNIRQIRNKSIFKNLKN